MNDVKKRFLEVYEYLLETKMVSGKGDFAKKIDISSSMMTDITKDRTNPGVNALRNVVEKFKSIDARWLLTGEGDMIVKYENTPSHTDSPAYANDDLRTYTPPAKRGETKPNFEEKLSPTPSPTTENCKLCVEKERLIAQQQITIDALMDANTQLKLRLEERKGDGDRKAG